jgi:hypothetical protein
MVAGCPPALVSRGPREANYRPLRPPWATLECTRAVAKRVRRRGGSVHVCSELCAMVGQSRPRPPSRYLPYLSLCRSLPRSRPRSRSWSRSWSRSRSRLRSRSWSRSRSRSWSRLRSRLLLRDVLLDRPRRPPPPLPPAPPRAPPLPPPLLLPTPTSPPPPPSPPPILTPPALGGSFGCPRSLSFSPYLWRRCSLSCLRFRVEG